MGWPGWRKLPPKQNTSSMCLFLHINTGSSRSLLSPLCTPCTATSTPKVCSPLDQGENTKQPSCSLTANQNPTGISHCSVMQPQAPHTSRLPMVAALADTTGQTCWGWHCGWDKGAVPCAMGTRKGGKHNVHLHRALALRTMRAASLDPELFCSHSSVQTSQPG